MELPIEFVIRGGRPDTIDALREYTTRRLSFALRRFERRIRHVTVRLVDLNGPRPGCRSKITPASRPDAADVGARVAPSVRSKLQAVSRPKVPFDQRDSNILVTGQT